MQDKAILHPNSHDYFKLFEVLAHDVKGPLEVMRIAAGEMITNKNKISEAQFDKLLNRFENNLGSITELLNNLLLWARNNQDKIGVNMTTFPLYHVAESSINTLNTFAQQKEISIINQIDKSISLITDKDILETIIRNLISNAIKFSHPDSTIHIEATIQSDYCTLKIKDAGIGMSEALINKIMDKGKVLSKYGTSNEKGSGLGLGICMAFADKLGGKLQFKSTEGQGLEVCFCIPS